MDERSHHSKENPKFMEFVGNLRSGQIALGLFEALPEVMFWLKDRQGAIVFANRAYADDIAVVGSNWKALCASLAPVFRCIGRCS